jgi:phage terminase small subunit
MNVQRELFCNEYLKGMTSSKGISATAAYMIAYPGTTEESARVDASKLMAKDEIKEYIANKVAIMVMGTNEALIRLGVLAREAERDADKLKAIELILKTQGAFIDRHDITTKGEKISWQQFINSEDVQRKSGMTFVGG